MILISLILWAVLLGSQTDHPKDPNEAHLLRVSSSTGFTHSLWLDVNRVKFHITNRGGLDFQAGIGNGGGFWPDTTDPDRNVILFDFGPWVIGKLNGTPAMGISQWGSSYSPGPAINGHAALVDQPGDSLRYRLYKITRGDNASTNPDYRDWPSDLGAPVDGQGKPRLYGDQTVWGVFNNLDTNAMSGWWHTHMPLPGLPVEIQQTVYAHGVPGADTEAVQGNVAFVEWTIINTAETAIESAYVSLWTDIDFNAVPTNVPAVDTTNQLGYCWQKYDNSYFAPPRAVGFVWLYGPSVPSPGSHAIFRGRPRANFKNISLSSFWGFRDDSYGDSSFYGPSYSMGTAWNIARGYDKVGNTVVDSVTHEATKFLYSGDPITGSGWVCPFGGGGAGFNMFSGPFTLAPHDTQWVMAALVPVSNPDRLECVRLLRQYAATLRAMDYQSLVVTSVPETSTPLQPMSMRLEQNYPNPFNPSTVIRYTVGGAGGQRPGAGEAGTRGLELGTRRTMLTVYDLLGRQVAVLVNEAKAPGSYEVTFDGSGVASGVYFYRMEAGDFVQTRKLCIIR